MEKTYSYKATKVQSRIVRAFRKSGRESTVADIISSTALPAVQVEEQLKEISSKYSGHVKVTESGEMIYFFPDGFRQKRLQSLLSKAGRKITRAAAFLFKIWTAVMLVGYAVVFTLLLLAAVFASIAATTSDRGRSRGRGSGMLISNIFGLIIRIWFWQSLTRPYGYGRSSYYGQRQRKKPAGKPLYQIVFSFLFGDREDIPDWQNAEEIELIRIIRKRKGIITVEEVMACTGKTYREAEKLLHKFCVHYNGEPKVSDNGSVYYEYTELLATSREADSSPSLPENMPMKVFSKNKSNAAVIGVNLFNLAFSSYFLYYSLFAGPVQLRDSFAVFYKFISALGQKYIGSPAASIIAIVLGIIPFAYSVLFFLVPALRNAALKKENRQRAVRNYRKRISGYVFGNPRNVQENFLPAPDNRIPDWENTRREILGSIGDAADIEIAENNGMYSYDYPELERKKQDIETLRTSIKREGIGGVIFSSDR